jgi:iron(III) transport system ATP-binding protein
LGAYQLITVSYQCHDYQIKQNNHLAESQQFKVGDNVSLTVLNHDFVVFADQ